MTTQNRSEKERDRWNDRQTDKQTDGQTEGKTLTFWQRKKNRKYISFAFSMHFSTTRLAAVVNITNIVRKIVISAVKCYA